MDSRIANAVTPIRVITILLSSLTTTLFGTRAATIKPGCRNYRRRFEYRSDNTECYFATDHPGRRTSFYGRRPHPMRFSIGYSRNTTRILSPELTPVCTGTDKHRRAITSLTAVQSAGRPTMVRQRSCTPLLAPTTPGV